MTIVNRLLREIYIDHRDNFFKMFLFSNEAQFVILDHQRKYLLHVSLTYTHSFVFFNLKHCMIFY